MSELKEINALNDYIAVMREIDIPDGVEIDKEQLESLSNEGVVVGKGGDVGDIVNVGDRIIFAKKRYLELKPASGCYEGKTILLIRKLDAVVCIGRSDYEVSSEIEELDAVGA